jgi:hypothetical protein
VTIYDLATAHVQHCGASETDAEAILLEFGATAGSDIGWADIVPSIPTRWFKRIDDYALGWTMRHKRIVGAVDEAEAISNATSEQIAQAMGSLPTDALEFAVRFEALSHTEPQFPPAPRAGTARVVPISAAIRAASSDKE